MLSIGDRGIFTVAAPFSIPNIEHTVVGIHTIATMLDMGLDVYRLVYQNAGYDRTAVRALNRDTSLYVLKSTEGMRYIPTSTVLDLTADTYVNYVDKAMVLNLGAQPKDRAFFTTIAGIAEKMLQLEGIQVTATVKDVSLPRQVTYSAHEELQDRREAAKSLQGTDNLMANRELEILELRARLSAVQRFLLQYANECKGQNCCSSPTETFLPSETVFYQYSLADFYLQASTGAVHDLPINNMFIDTLHSLNVRDEVFHKTTTTDPCLNYLTALGVL